MFSAHRKITIHRKTKCGSRIAHRDALKRSGIPSFRQWFCPVICAAGMNPAHSWHTMLVRERGFAVRLGMHSFISEKGAYRDESSNYGGDRFVPHRLGAAQTRSLHLRVVVAGCRNRPIAALKCNSPLMSCPEPCDWPRRTMTRCLEGSISTR